MAPDKPPEKFFGTEAVRALGEAWIIAEGTGEAPGGGIGQTIMSLGRDAATGRFVGTFISSMMAYLWVYNGSLDAAEKKLTLDAEGPNFDQTGLAKYQDIIEFVSDDHRTMTSQIQTADGGWMQFMSGHYRRKR